MGQAIQAQCKQSDLKAMDFHSQEKDLNNISAVVDFSSPDGFITCANYCIENKIPLISGTTGLSDEHLEIVSTAKKSHITCFKYVTWNCKFEELNRAVFIIN